MALSLVFLVFVLCMTGALVLNISMVYPLLIGFLLFSALAKRMGYSPKQILSFAGSSLKDSFIVIRIMLVIGCLIGLWRQSGTIAYFVSFGVSLIPAWGFLLAAFLLTAIMSFAIGTSFGVTATAGVILISIARAAGVDPVLTAGAILSGVYVGDRGSPAASSANLVAVLTKTDMRRNIALMMRSAWLPILVCCVLYTVLSLLLPSMEAASDIPALLGEEFVLSIWCLLPAVLMIVLPFAGLNVLWSMLISLLSAMGISLFVQHASLWECLTCMVEGYNARNAQLDSMVSGGGITSMLQVSIILLISGTYGGIFRGTKMLDRFNRALEKVAGRLGRYPVMLMLSFGVCALFCNQTIGAIMQSQLSSSLYGDEPAEREAKMLHMENSVILVAGLVPWCIASSVPLAMLGSNAASIPIAFYLWLVPAFTLIASLKKRKKSAA